MAKDRMNISVDVEWIARVREAAKGRGVTMSKLIEDLVTNGLDEVEEFAQAASNPVFMDAMRGMFGNPVVMASIVEIMQQQQPSKEQMELFGDGMEAFTTAIEKGKKK